MPAEKTRWRDRERPNCRRAIEKFGLKPLLIGNEWDYRTCVGPEGNQWLITRNVLLQLRKMVREGHWGEIRINRKLRHLPASRSFPQNEVHPA